MVRHRDNATDVRLSVTARNYWEWSWQQVSDSDHWANTWDNKVILTLAAAKLSFPVYILTQLL